MAPPNLIHLFLSSSRSKAPRRRGWARWKSGQLNSSRGALAAEPTGWAVCEWAVGLWGRGRSVDRQAGSPAPLAQSGRSNARTSRSEYVSGAARSRLLPRTARAPGARDPSPARRGLYPENRDHPRPLPPESSGVESRSAPDPPGPVRPDSRGTDLPASPRSAGLGDTSVTEPPVCFAPPPCRGSLGLCPSLLLGRPQPRRRGPARPPERPGLWPEPARRRGFCRCSLGCCCRRCCCPPAAGRWKVSGVGVPRAIGELRRVGAAG